MHQEIQRNHASSSESPEFFSLLAGGAELQHCLVDDRAE
jgi:hypothetical protein